MKNTDMNEKPKNSSMASTEEEMKNLGREMEQMKTKEELAEKSKTSDPKQEENPS
ncbi:hypothetical protein [Cytobacillus purgationiresistens]|uniref:Multidrug ABC transporter ATPase n=1 Tax=Cytobacillus purgationiresistens TaxID=863449 RepID=A0ABU0ARD9_9BACI|nr:hypothetical protein [Cytobacillus purgationiresistens]MDQ0273773.1 hypothetical protein [Cytobacillus purgationiresistens]